MIIFPHAFHHFHIIFSTGSGLWEHFERKKTGEGRCRICQCHYASLSRRKSTQNSHSETLLQTKSLRKSYFGVGKGCVFVALTSTKPVTTQPSVKTLWEAKEKESIGLVLSRLAAVDGIAFARIANS